MSKIIFVLSAAFALLSHQVPVHARMLKRAQPSAEAEERARKFDNFANVYAFNWARTQAMADTVRDVYVSGDWDRDFDSKTKLFFPQRLAGPAHAERIRMNLKSRVPIYLGGALHADIVNNLPYVQTLRELNSGDDNFSQKYGAKVGNAITQNDKDTLLRSMAQRMDREYYAANVKDPVRFGVCGPVRRIGANNHGTTLMYVSHIWGINLERRVTADFMRFTEGTGEITKRDEYEATFREILTFAFEGAAHAAETEGKLASLRIPKVSLGAFLTAIPENSDSRKFAHEAFYKAVFELARLYRARNVTVVLCLFSGTSGIKDILAKYPPLGEKSNVKIETDLFDLSTTDVSGQAMPADIVTVQINAWDSHSYMGNGQINDWSIDGFMVAGYHHGENNANTSFLQNPIFSSYAHDSKFWQVCSPESSSAVPVAEEVPEETEDGSAGAATPVCCPADDEEDEESSNSSSCSSSAPSMADEEGGTPVAADEDGSPSPAKAATSIQKIGRRFLAKNLVAIKAAQSVSILEPEEVQKETDEDSTISATAVSGTADDEEHAESKDDDDKSSTSQHEPKGSFCGC